MVRNYESNIPVSRYQKPLGRPEIIVPKRVIKTLATISTQAQRSALETVAPTLSQEGQTVEAVEEQRS